MKTTRTSPAPIAYSYVRFSTPEQAKGDSLRRQTEAAAAWCKANGARLDESTTLHDLGKSAYTGSHRKNPDRNALAAFLKLVDDGRVPRGSYLIIENLDRLSREDIQPALLLVLNLLQSGVRVVQLVPATMTFDDKSDAMQVMMMVMELSRGHSESAVKSARQAAAWDRKRGNLGAKKLTGKVPFWLALNDAGTRLTVKPEAAALVKRVFRLARDGYGSAVIAKRLNADKVPSPYGVKVIEEDAEGNECEKTNDDGSRLRLPRPWNNVSVLALLRSRAVLGEFTPHRGRSGGRTPAGPPVPGYYPRVIDDDEYYAVQAAIRGRQRQRGPRGRGVKNLFTGLLVDAIDGTPVYLNEKRPGDTRMVSYGSIRGEGKSRRPTFPYGVFEAEVLAKLRELNPRDVLGDDGGADEVMAKTAELERVEAKIAEYAAELENGDVAALAKALREKEGEKRKLVAELSEARAKAAEPASGAWAEYKSLADMLSRAADPEDVRTRLRAALRRMVESMPCVIVGKGRVRVAAVQVWFAGGAACRDYLIVSNGAKRRAWSLADVAPDGLDLRKPKDARALEKLLATADLPTP